MRRTNQQRIAAICMALVMGLSFFPVHAFTQTATPETAPEPSEEQQLAFWQYLLDDNREVTGQWN